MIRRLHFASCSWNPGKELRGSGGGKMVAEQVTRVAGALFCSGGRLPPSAVMPTCSMHRNLGIGHERGMYPSPCVLRTSQLGCALARPWRLGGRSADVLPPASEMFYLLLLSGLPATPVHSTKKRADCPPRMPDFTRTEGRGTRLDQSFEV